MKTTLIVLLDQHYDNKSFTITIMTIIMILVNMLTITINMLTITTVKIGRSKLCARDLADKVDACQGETQIILAMLAMMEMMVIRALESESFCDIQNTQHI